VLNGAKFSGELERCLNQAIHQARSAHHEFRRVERLLLAIIDTPTVREVLKGCGADLDQLSVDLPASRRGQHSEAGTAIYRNPTHTYSIANSTPSPTLWLMLAATTLLDFSCQ
jgi:ATP-dependent Clp protease ATP-binding subunit ClpA